MRIGRWEARSLEFGRFRLDGGAMFGVVPKTLWEKASPADEKNRIEMALRCLLLEDGERRVLVDCGVGDKESDKFRQIFALEDAGSDVPTELAKRGLKPEDITDLVLTHLHFDHAGGAVRRKQDGTLAAAFPNARIHMQRKQWEWALKPSARDRASYLEDNLRPLEQMDLHLHEGDVELLPGLKARTVHGHTPSMQLIEVLDTDGNAGLVYCADLVPTAAHLPPAWVMGYDLEPLRAMNEKLALYRDLAGGNCWLVFEHDPHCAAVRIDDIDGKIRIREERLGL